MAYTQRDNSGSSFKNDRKRKGKKDADYAGSLMVNGQEFWIDTWVKNSPKSEDYDPNKKTFLSHSLRPKEARNQPDRQHQPPPRRQAPAPPPPSKEPVDHQPRDTDTEYPF